MLSIVIFLPYESFLGEPTSLLFSSLYLSLHRIAWSFAFGWLVYACSTGQGYFINSILSFEFFSSLSSLSYLAYLIHPILMLYHTGMVRERVNLSHYQLLNTFLARVVLAFSSAFLLYVIVELPFGNIEKYLFPKSAKNKQTSIDQIDNDKRKQLQNSSTKNDYHFSHPNQQQQYFNTIGGTTPNKNINQLTAYNQLAPNQKKVITDYCTSSSMNRYHSQMNRNFKEKHHLNLGNQRKVADKYLVDNGQLIDRRQQQLSRYNQYYPYLNEQDRQLNQKYFLYRQKPINQYYFYAGSRTNTLSNDKNRQQISHSKELSNFDNDTTKISSNEQTKIISLNERTITTSSLTATANNNDVDKNSQNKDITIKKSTNDTQLTNTLSNRTSNESVNILSTEDSSEDSSMGDRLQKEQCVHPN